MHRSGQDIPDRRQGSAEGIGKQNYVSADQEVATVSETGLVTGVKKGVTYIRVTAANGVYGECEVIVDDTWVEFGADRITLVKGEERVLNAKVFPENIF